METLEKCLQSLKTSKSDNERLAALMVISKLTQSTNENVNINTNITKELASDLYGAVSTKFILRLLKRSQDKEDNSALFHQLALNVLSVVAKSNPGVITKDKLVVEGLISLLKCTSAQMDEKQNILELLMMILPRDKKLDSIDGVDMIRIGVDILMKCDAMRSVAETFLSLLLSNGCYGQDTACIVLGYSEILVNNQEMEKFNELAKISTFMRLLQKLEYKPEKFDEKVKTSIFKNIYSATSDLLKSRIKVEYKRLVIDLISSTIQVFGMDWVFQVSGGDETKFCVLILVSISVELAWLLNQDSVNEGLEKQRDFIIGCFEVTKSFLVCLCSDKFEDNPLSANSSFIVNMFNTFKNIVTSVYSFLQTFLTVEDAGCLDDPIVIESIALVCVWATEETESLQDELKSVIPFMMKVGKKMANDGVDDTSDFFSSFVPCIAQLIPDDEIRKILLKSDSILLLQDICWNVLNREGSEKSHQLLECVIHAFHEVIILAPAHCKQTTWKPSLINQLIDMHYRCSGNRGLLTLYSRFELAAVLLRLSQLCGIETSLEKFLPSVTQFLSLTVKDLEDMDESYTDMWFVALQSLIEVVSTNELQRKKLKTDQAVQRVVSGAGVEVCSQSIRTLISDFQRILYA